MGSHDCIKPILNKMVLYIFLRETPSYLSDKKVFQNHANHILNTAANGTEIYKFITQKILEHKTVTEYEDSIPLASSLLNEFQRQHKKFNYHIALRHLTKQQDSNQKLKWQYEVTVKSLRSFVDLILYKVVPLRLFGKVKNRIMVKKAAFDLLATFDPLNLEQLVKKLDISRIPWIMLIKNKEMRYLMILKFLSWFFNGFFLKILYAHLHVTSLPPAHGERLYIRRSDWYSFQKHFISKKIRTKFLQLDVQGDQWNMTTGQYKLFLKPHGVRLIFMPKYQEKVKKNMRVVLNFLKQLIPPQSNSSSFYEQWKLVVKQKRASGNKNTHLIACDVSNAFDSVLQGQLYDIIRSLCENLPSQLKLQWYISQTGKPSYYNPQKMNQYFCHEKLPLPFRNSTFCVAKHYGESRWIDKAWLLNEIWTYIFCQRVKIGNRTFSIGKGVPQGTMLSPILSNIYYTFVFNKEMATFMKSGFLIRHADDILYVTMSNSSAKQFYRVIQEGLPQYNCSFKSTKMQSNVVYNQGTILSSIIYFGYNIDCNTLEVTPANLDSKRCVLKYSEPRVAQVLFLEAYLRNISCFKLTEVVLDQSINSENTINRTLKEMGLLQARRAAILIEKLFEDVDKDARNIANIIKRTNKAIANRILRTILRTRNMSDGQQYGWKKKISRILCNSYKHVFKKNNVLLQAMFKHDQNFV